MNTTTYSTYLFNGTAVSAIEISHQEMKKAGLDCIMSVVQDPSSQTYKNPKMFGSLLMSIMILWEDKLNSTCSGKKVTKERIEKTIKRLGLDYTADQFADAWNINICMLLLLKKIENNENYGLLEFQMNCKGGAFGRATTRTSGKTNGINKPRRGKGVAIIKNKKFTVKTAIRPHQAGMNVMRVVHTAF
tara:strand:+ start:513 stop:1079 length:567 start_codon:yes stop_codon:yes gene_type:complete